MKFFGWRVYTVLRNQGKTLPARGPLDCPLQEKGAPLEKIIKFTFPVSTVVWENTFLMLDLTWFFKALRYYVNIHVYVLY